MSPVAAAMALLLHALVALAFLWELPRHEAEAAERAIEFTVEVPSAPPAEPQVPAAPATAPPQAAAPTPSVPPSPPPRLGLARPRSLTPDPSAKPAAPQPGPTPSETPTQATEPAKQEPTKPEPEPQQAAAASPPPPEPKLEQVLPPVEAPPPPLTAQDFPKPAPPPPPKPPPPKAPPPPPQRAQVPPPQQRLQPSPLSRVPQQRPPADSHASAQPAPSPLTNPASQYGQRKAEDDYLWLVMRKLSQYRYYPKSNVVSEEGVVVMRITVARDGRLLDVALARSSGYPNLDSGVMDTLRQAAPFARLPADIPGDRHTFILPVNYVHQR